MNYFLMSSKEFVLITEIFWHIFWRTFCLHYLTLYKTPATGLFPKNQTFFYGGLNSAMFALLTHLRHPNYHNFMIYECFCINKILFTFFQLLKTSFNWEHFCWLTNRKFIFSTKSKPKKLTDDISFEQLKKKQTSYWSKTGHFLSLPVEKKIIIDIR